MTQQVQNHRGTPATRSTGEASATRTMREASATRSMRRASATRAGAIALVYCLLAALACPTVASAAERPPNIVFIWADNLGYGDLSVYGSKRIKTPTIDRLAAGGVRMTQYYIAHVVCSPSRAGLLTGRQPFRAGIVDVLRPDSPTGLPPEEITLAEALRGKGERYDTAAFGKWHLGDRTQYLPTRQGFRIFFGLPYSMDMLPTVFYRQEEIIEVLEGDKVQTVTVRMIDEAIRFIREPRERPFFLYFCHTLPHPPLNLPPRSRTPGRPIYEDAIEHLDHETGRLLEAIDAEGLADNTLVIFTSDNGPMARDGSAGPLRGRIRDAHEGGIRVPLVVRWPGKIPAGRVVDTPAIAYDIFPTLVRLAGGELPDDRVYDGQDIWPLWSGGGDFERQRPLIWVYTDQVTAIRDGRWKLHVAQQNRKLQRPELYDIENDPAEAKVLTEEYPDVVARLRKITDEFQLQIPKAWSLVYPVRDPEKWPSGVRRE